MILDFIVDETNYGEYCPVCHAHFTGQPIIEQDLKVFVCTACSSKNDRLLIIDPSVKWWLDEDKHYCHESAGIMLINSKQQILFYALTKYPYGFTIPAGHVDIRETPQAAVVRETHEEVHIQLQSPRLIISTTIHGDSCRRGSDDHQWSLFIDKINEDTAQRVSVNPVEGKQPRWVALSEVKSLKKPFAMDYLWNTYQNEILAAITSTGSSTAS